MQFPLAPENDRVSRSHGLTIRFVEANLHERAMRRFGDLTPETVEPGLMDEGDFRSGDDGSERAQSAALVFHRRVTEQDTKNRRRRTLSQRLGNRIHVTSENVVAKESQSQRGRNWRSAKYLASIRRCARDDLRS